MFPNSLAPSLLYNLHTTHNSSIRSDESLTLEKSAFRIPVRLSIYIINSVVKIFVYNSLYRHSTTVSLEIAPVIHSSEILLLVKQ